MEGKLIEIKKKSELKAKSDNEYRMLIASEDEFIPLEIVNNEEELVLAYEIKDLKESIQVKNESKDSILIFLINVSKIKQKTLEYEINLEPSNIYINYKFDVKIKFRDINRNLDRFDDEEFLKKYKSLIGFMLNSRYEYIDYYEGGLDLLNKDKFLKAINNAKTMEDTVEILKEELVKVKEDNIKNKVMIDKKNLKRIKQIKNALTISTIVLGGYFLYTSLVTAPYNLNVINASNAFVKSDYEKVIQHLNDISIEKLSKDNKYILANSYVNSENLSAIQKKNILATISPQSQEEILNFWIAQGKMELNLAIDIAKKLGDNELLMYSLIKREQQILNDNSLDGETKEELLNKTKGEIDKLSESFNEENKETSETQDSISSNN